MTWRLMIVEDEGQARNWLEKLVGMDPDWDLVGSFEEAGQILPACESLRPDLLLLDISLHQVDVFEVLRSWSIEQRPKIVFITASQEHAIQAFDESGVDYVLKPFNRERLHVALDKAKAALRSNVLVPSKLSETAGSDYLQHLNIQDEGQSIWIPVEQIDWIEGADYYVKIHVGQQWYWSRTSLKTLERRLDPKHFIRTHKSAIVHLSRIQAYLEPAFGGMQIQLKTGQTVKVSRRQKRRILAMLKEGGL